MELQNVSKQLKAVRKSYETYNNWKKKHKKKTFRKICKSLFHQKGVKLKPIAQKAKQPFSTLARPIFESN